MVGKIEAAIEARMAGSPSTVAGILIITLGRSTAFHRARACAIDPSVSRARSGDTSMETKPSAPSAASSSPANVVGATPCPPNACATMPMNCAHRSR